jgi:hypothetical protein
MPTKYNVIYLDLENGKKIYTDRAFAGALGQFKYIQDTPASIWTIVHNMNSDKFNIKISDGLNPIFPDSVEISNSNTITISFAGVPVAGSAVVVFFGYGSVTLPTPTPTSSVTATITPTLTSTITPSVTRTVPIIPTITPTPTPPISVTPSVTVSVTTSVTPSITQSITVTPSLTPTISVTSTVTPSVTLSVTSTLTVTPTSTISLSASNLPLVTQTPTPTGSPLVTPTSSTSIPPSPTPTPSVTSSMGSFNLAAHPRMLDAPTIANMSSEYTNNTLLWQTVDAYYSPFVNGTVNNPTANGYPDSPNIGEGYQGSGYIDMLLGMCLMYQAIKVTNPSAAAPYGAQAVNILVTMSQTGSYAAIPSTDDGYGIRNYGVAFGLGYDYVYELMTPTQRSLVYTTANSWITYFETGSYAYGGPCSNYFAGYFHAKCAIALGTYDENPNGPSYWQDWYHNEFTNRLAPYFTTNLAGGGWPEGFANYGPPAIINTVLTVAEVKSATSIDLTTQPFTFPLDSADYLMHFAWPNLTYFDDRDTNHQQDAVIPGTITLSVYHVILDVLKRHNSAKVPVFRQYIKSVTEALGQDDTVPWQLLLTVDNDTTVTPISTLPLSYHATGLNAVALRSDWTTSASWASFRAGGYVDYVDQSEELYDQGSLAIVKGSNPLLVNAYGWIVHDPNGETDENLIYNDIFGGSDPSSVYDGNAQCFNIFYVRDITGTTVNQRYGQTAKTTADDGVRTHTSHEDNSSYTYTKAVHIEDMYKSFTNNDGVTGFQREIVYLRPNRFVVMDRTSMGNAGFDQFLAWHFPASPIDHGSYLNVEYNSVNVGTMTTVLPANTTNTIIPLYPTSADPKKVFQVQVRPQTNSLNQNWLTVFDLAETPATLTVLTSSSYAVLLSGIDGDQVVVFSNGSTVTYQNASGVAAQHIVAGLNSSVGYSATYNAGNIVIALGGNIVSSSNGTITFNVDNSGAIS